MVDGEKILMVDDNVLHKVLGKIKAIIGIEKFDDTKTLIDTGHKLSDDIALKNVVILMTCVINDRNKFYPLLFLEKGVYDKQPCGEKLMAWCNKY